MMNAMREMEILRCQVHEQLIDIFNIPVQERVGQLEYNSMNLEEVKPVPSTSGTPHITELPPKIIQLIFKTLNYKTIAELRLVCKYFEGNCAYLLNSEFYNLQVLIQTKVQAVKSVMPKRVSSRKKHPRAHECEILETLSLRMSLLNMAFDKPIENKQCCFFPGEIIDEVHSILKYLAVTPNSRRAFDVTKELYEISNMAFEHLRKCVKPFESPKRSFLFGDEPSYMTAGSSSSGNRYSQEIVVKPKKDRYNKIKKLINDTDHLALRNRKDILMMRESLRTAKYKLLDAARDIQQYLHQKVAGLNFFYAIDDSTDDSSPEVHIICDENEADSTENLPAETKKNKSVSMDHFTDNLTEPPMKKKK